LTSVSCILSVFACASPSWNSSSGLDIIARRDRGEKIDSKDIDKHRTDVFRLAATLPGAPGPELAASVLADLNRFLTAFPDESSEWLRILDSLKSIFGGDLRLALQQ
jgi:hypothetical protein